MSTDYMSSEDEEEKEGKKTFIVRHKNWASDTVQNIFKSLDEQYVEKLQSKKGLYQKLPRRDGPDSSDLSIPPETPNWALKQGVTKSGV